jgi:diacylglycerol kinase (ATP)
MEMGGYGRVVLFHNLLARNASEQVLAAVRMRLVRTAGTLEEHDLGGEQAIREKVQQGLANRPDLVVVAGGDGTVGMVASKMVRTGIPLAVIPTGTFNNFARSLGMPSDPIAACEVIESGIVVPIDAAVADEQHAFFEAAGVGVDAEMFPIGEEIKQGRILSVFRAIRAAFVHRQSAVDLRFDRPLNEAYRMSYQGDTPLSRRRRRFRKSRRRIRVRCSFVAIANGPFYGSNLTVCPGAKMDDGLLTIAVYRDFSKLELARHLWSISRGRYQRHPKMEMFESSSLEVACRRPLSVHVDGNTIGTTPVRFDALRGALTVLAPRSYLHK